MKRKLIVFAVMLTLALLLLPACDARKAGSLKTITRPYIATYECIEATLGGEDMLEKFDYIEIVLVDSKQMELIYKPKNGDKKIVKSDYSLDLQTHELTAEIGIYGYNFRESTVIENGKFTISKKIGTKQLIMKFQMK